MCRTPHKALGKFASLTFESNKSNAQLRKLPGIRMEPAIGGGQGGWLAGEKGRMEFPPAAFSNQLKGMFCDMNLFLYLPKENSGHK